MNKSKNRFLEGNLTENIIRYTIPIILTSLLQLLFNAADLIVVGRFCGSVSVAAVGATGAITMLIVNLFIGLSIGAGVWAAVGCGGRQGFVTGMVVALLYMMTGKWSRDIAEYMAWSLEYQLWVMDKVFGRQIRSSHEAAQEAERNVPLVKNLLTDMAETFTADDLKRHFIALGKKPSAVGNYLRQQLHRKNLTRHGEAYRKTERFKQRYEG